MERLFLSLAFSFSIDWQFMNNASRYIFSHIPFVKKN